MIKTLAEIVHDHPELLKDLPNLLNPVMRIKYADLELRPGDGSMYRRKCPKCSDGILLVARNQETWKIEAFDRCISCGQAVEYTDHETVFADEVVIRNALKQQGKIT